MQLHQIKLFATLDKLLAAATPEDIARHCNNEPLEKNDVVVGTVPPLLQALFAVSHQLRAEVDALAEKYREALSNGVTDISDLETAGVTKLYEAKEMSNLFWHALHAEFPVLCTKQCVGVRTGWQVVTMEKPETDDAADRIGFVAISSDDPGLADLLRAAFFGEKPATTQAGKGPH